MRTTTAPTLPQTLERLGVFVTMTPGDNHADGCETAPGFAHSHHRATIHRRSETYTGVVVGPIDWHAGTAVRPTPHPTTGRVSSREAADVVYAVWQDVTSLADDAGGDGVSMMIDARYHEGNLASEGDLRDILATLETVRGHGRAFYAAFGPGETEALAEAVSEW